MAQIGGGRLVHQILAHQIAIVVDGHPDILLGQEIRRGERTFGAIDNLGATGVGVFFAQRQQLLFDDAQNLGGVGQQFFQVLDALLKFVKLILELLALQGGQTAQLQVENRLRLHFREFEVFDQVAARRIDTLAMANSVNHLVQNIEGMEQAFDNVGALFGLGELKFRAATHNLFAMLDKEMEGAF